MLGFIGPLERGSIPRPVPTERIHVENHGLIVPDVQSNCAFLYLFTVDFFHILLEGKNFKRKLYSSHTCIHICARIYTHVPGCV